MSDMLDIINEADEVIGRVSFKEAHEKGLLHRFCRVLVMNDKDEFVLHRRPARFSDAGKLDSAGGHVDAGENYEQAAHRELMEEMNIEVSEMKELGVIRYQKSTSSLGIENMLGKAYLVRHNGPYKPQAEEVDGDFECLTLAKLQQEVEKGNVSDKVVHSLKYLEE